MGVNNERNGVRPVGPTSYFSELVDMILSFISKKKKEQIKKYILKKMKKIDVDIGMIK